MVFCYSSPDGLRKLVLRTWDATETNTCFSGLNFSDRSGPLESKSPFTPLLRYCAVGFNEQGYVFRGLLSGEMSILPGSWEAAWKSFFSLVQSPSRAAQGMASGKLIPNVQPPLTNKLPLCPWHPLTQVPCRLFCFSHTPVNKLLTHLLMTIFKTWNC